MRNKRLLARLAALEQRPGIVAPVLVVIRQFRADGPDTPDRRLTPDEAAGFAAATRRGDGAFTIYRPVRLQQKDPQYA